MSDDPNPGNKPQIMAVVRRLADALGTISPAVSLSSPDRSRFVEAAVGEAGAALVACNRAMAEAAEIMRRAREVSRNPLSTRDARIAVAKDLDQWLARYDGTEGRTLH